MMNVSLSFAANAANGNMFLLLLAMGIVALALIVTRETTA